MHYMKCGVNGLLLHNSGCCRRSVWHLESLFYHDAQYSQRGWYITNLLLFDIPRNKAPRTGPHHVCHTYTLCPFFACEKNTDGSTVGLMISLASVCYGNFCLGLLMLLLLLFLFFFFLKIVFNIASLSTWLSMSATRISLMASSSSFIF